MRYLAVVGVFALIFALFGLLNFVFNLNPDLFGVLAVASILWFTVSVTRHFTKGN